jgi:hypothetical protein
MDTVKLGKKGQLSLPAGVLRRLPHLAGGESGCCGNCFVPGSM